jgi:hypothetical protein
MTIVVFGTAHIVLKVKQFEELTFPLAMIKMRRDLEVRLFRGYS